MNITGYSQMDGYDKRDKPCAARNSKRKHGDYSFISKKILL